MKVSTPVITGMKIVVFSVLHMSFVMTDSTLLNRQDARVLHRSLEKYFYTLFSGLSGCVSLHFSLKYTQTVLQGHFFSLFLA